MNLEQFNLNFVGVRIEYDLYALSTFLEFSEKQIKFIQDQETVRHDALLKSKKFNLTEEDYAISIFEFRDLIVRIIPRYFRNPFLVSLWALYESALVEIAAYIKNIQRGKISEEIKNRKEKGFLNKAREYFQEELHISLSNNNSWKHIRMLNVLRNSIAHGNGRIEAINKNNIKKIMGWEKENIGIFILDGNIMFSGEFLNNIFEKVNESLTNILELQKNDKIKGI